MVKITLFPESAIYENVKDAANSKDVSDFIDTLVEYGENIDVEQIKNELENCDDIEELDAVFKKYFNRSWISLEVAHLDYDETDDLEDAKTKIEYKANNDDIIYDFVDAEYNEATNTCDLKFCDKFFGIMAYIHNVPIPEWLKTEEDGKLVYIFDNEDWQSDKVIEYALGHGVKEIVKEIERS